MAKATRRASGAPGAAPGKTGIGLALALLTSWLGLAHSVSSASTEEAATGTPDTSGMVRIPAGKFWYGCKEQLDVDCDPDEKPGQWIESPGFWIDRTEVTVQAFHGCALANVCPTAGLRMPYWKDEERPSWAWACNWGKQGREKHPMNCVSWSQASTYCEWAGKRLPSEQEWERAARGAGGSKYPWGSAGYGEAGPVANIADETLAREKPRWPAAKGYDDGFYATAPVGSFPAGSSPEGALDMLGNVWEWTSSWSDPDHKYRVARGGSWANAPQLVRASNRYRFNPAYRGETFGFRCVSESSAP
jgi:formylglycine-generating enzyme required for sulfatase activity